LIQLGNLFRRLPVKKAVSGLAPRLTPAEN